MKEVDYTEYAMVSAKKYYAKRMLECNCKTFLMNNNFVILFVPKEIYESDAIKRDKGFHQLKVNWLIMKPILRRLINEDEWMCKFENDANWDDLEEIEEEVNDPIDRLDATKRYFGNEDPIIHTRLLIDPWKDNNFPIVIYYGETISFQDNTDENISKVIHEIWKEYKNYDYTLKKVK